MRDLAELRRLLAAALDAVEVGEVRGVADALAELLPEAVAASEATEALAYPDPPHRRWTLLDVAPVMPGLKVWQPNPRKPRKP